MYMMKKILLLAGIVSLAACTNDPEETFSQGGGSSAGVKVIYDAEGAVEGQLIVKFRPSAADSLAAALASASATRAGFATADELLAAVGVDGIRPLFGSDPRFEGRHRAFGLHQWYVVTFDESLPLREMVGELSHDGRIEVLEYARCPRLKNRFPARPLRSAAAAATLFFPRSDEQRMRAAQKNAGEKKPLSLRPLLRDPMVLFLLIANFVISVGICAYTYLPLYASELGYDNNACGLLNAFSALSEIPTLLLIDRVMKKIRGTTIIVASAFFCALRLFLTYVSGFFGAGAFAMLTVAQLLQSVSYMTNYYCSANLIHERFPQELKSTAQTLLAMITAGFSRIFGSLVGGYLSESSVLGLQNTFLFFALFLLAGSFVVLLAYRRAERPAANNRAGM